MDIRNKGLELENSVVTIETAILKQNPSYNEKDFIIQPRKIIIVDGVRHEIDIWVEISIGKGYNPIFIFECKNWEFKVGKNEVIIFAEKIEASKAQKGFFLAKNYTSYAMKQAKKYPRMELLEVSEEFEFQLPNFHYFLRNLSKIGVEAYTRGIEKDPSKKYLELPIDNIECSLFGEKRILKDYLIERANEAVDYYCNHIDSSNMPEGTYKQTLDKELRYQKNELIVNEQDIETLSLNIDFIFNIVKPTIISKFEVKGRAHIINLSPASFGGIGGSGNMRVSFIRH